MQIITKKNLHGCGILFVATAMSLAASIASANMRVYPMAVSIGAGSGSAAALRIFRNPTRRSR